MYKILKWKILKWKFKSMWCAYKRQIYMTSENLLPFCDLFCLALELSQAKYRDAETQSQDIVHVLIQLPILIELNLRCNENT